MNGSLCVCAQGWAGDPAGPGWWPDLPVADSLEARDGAMAGTVYLVEVEIVLRLLQPEFLALLLANTQQQIIKHMVIPVGDQQGESVHGQGHSTVKGGWDGSAGQGTCC